MTAAATKSERNQQPNVDPGIILMYLAIPFLLETMMILMRMMGPII
jgi:hypothetical protein